MKGKKKEPDPDLTTKEKITPWNSPCVVLGSGPSLGWDDYADVETIKNAGLKTIAVNTTWEVARFCDIIYAGDAIWWKHNAKLIDIKAVRWTCARNAIGLYGCNYRARKIKPGYNSGALAIELAANVYKAAPIILLGFDISLAHGIHHHGKHKHTANPNGDRAKKWIAQFRCLKDRIGEAKVINCSRYTELGYFERRPLNEVLSEL